MNKFLGALIVIIIVAGGLYWWNVRSVATQNTMETYTNGAYGFSFSYASSTPVQEYTPEIISVGTQDQSGVADVIVATDDDNASNESDLAHQKAMLMCAADGPEGSLSCTGVATSSSFKNDNGLSGEEFYLTEVSTNAKGTTKNEFGPIFSFDLSANVSSSTYAALVVLPALSATGASPLDAQLAQSIAESMQIQSVQQ